MADSVKTDEIELSDLVKKYEAYAEFAQESRARADRDRDYYDHKQLSSEVLADLKKRKQAPTIINKVQENVNYLLGLERQNRADPKAYPRTPLHEDAAHAASDSIRYVCDASSFDTISSAAYKNILIEGNCGAVIEVEPLKLGDYKVSITRIPEDRIFHDPHSEEEDYSDDTYRGYIKWMDQSEAEDFGKKYGYTGSFSTEESIYGDAGNDKPSYKMWYDGNRKRVKISFIWFLKKGVWMHAIYSKSGIIWGPKPCPYEDEDGNPECNFVTQSAIVDRDNSRYGYVRALISQQDAINKRESKTLHLLSQRQTWSKRGAFSDVNQAKRELGKPDGHIEVDDGRELGRDFGILSTGDMAQGQFQLLQSAKQDIDAVGASGSAGESSASASGRALEARAESGSIKLTPFTDAHKQWKIRVYRCVWNKIRQFWPEEKWIRVTDDEDNLKWVGLNSPITLAEQMIAQQTGEKSFDIKKKYADQLEQLITQQPELGEVVEVENPVADLDVDIIIDEVQDVINIQSEQFMMIAKLAERRGDIPTSLIIKMSQLRNKDQIIDQMEGDEAQKAAQADKQQVVEESQLRLAQAETVETEAKAEKAKQEAVQKAIENQILQTQVVEAQVII